MMIEVKSMTEVSVDGVSAGCVADAFANFPDQRAAIQDAVMLFEQGLRQQIATLQAELQTAVENAEKATADAAEAVQKATIDAADTVSQGQQAATAAIEAARVENVQAMNNLIIDANQKIAAAQTAAAQSKADSDAAIATATAAVQIAQAKEAAAVKLQNLHWEQTKACMDNNSEAALAVLKEIRTQELAAKKAANDADIAAREKVLGV